MKIQKDLLMWIWINNAPGDDPTNTKTLDM